MPIVVSWTLTIEEYITNGVVRHRLSWIFFCDDGSEHHGTQDRAPATRENHETWLALQAAAFTVATSEPEIVEGSSGG